MLPGEDGIGVMKRLRRAGYDFPVIMVTAKNSEYDKVTGLDCGAEIIKTVRSVGYKVCG